MDESAAEISLMENRVAMNIEFGESLENVWYNDVPHRRINNVKFTSKYEFSEKIFF